MCIEIHRSSTYQQLHRALVSALRPQLRHGISSDDIALDSYRIRLSNHFLKQADYLSPEAEMPLYSQGADEALAGCTEKMGPKHLRIVLEWREDAVNQ